LTGKFALWRTRTPGRVAWLLIQAGSILFPTFEAPPLGMKESKDAKPDSSGYFKNLDLLGNAPERALLRGRGDAV